MTSMAMTETARTFELGSYGLIAALGLFLLFRKVRGLVRNGHGHGHDHVHGPDCGHSHAPSPDAVADVRSIGGALAAVFSVGIRPCSGALIVLAFALAQGIFWAGVASTFLMGLGTALTVAVLAVTAVYAKSFATRMAGAGSNRAGIVLTGLEIAGALAITALGLLLLAGALSG
jgi:ABC-type nickel/cobalt efflux system permease component RcnA